MNDAAEVLIALYEQLTPLAARAGQAQLLDSIFGTRVEVVSARYMQCHLQPCLAHSLPMA